VDWNAIHAQYVQRIDGKMNDESFFLLMSEMLSELKDGHVNLSSGFDTSRYWHWFQDYPQNFSQELVDYYLGDDYRMSSGMRYKILSDNIGYLRYPDFSVGIGETNLDYVLQKFELCDGLIIDVRDNGGGLLSNSDLLAERFINEKTLVGYIQHKTGPGHDSFSEPKPKYLTPSKRLRFQKTVVVLTNRGCFSATNDFVNAMTYAPNAIILGDNTGGGSGLPFTSELPNGWTIRFSACPMYNAEMKQIEFGIEPDVKVSLLESDEKRHVDTLIEEAKKLIIISYL
jgi:C-terminal processing protease CtpA/Prc